MKKLSTLTLTVFCWVLFVATAWTQKTISGKVTGQSDGVALPGVNVVLKGTTKGTITDIDGNYTLSVPNTATTLTFSYVGFLNKDIDIGNASTVDVALSEDSKQLDAVVVTSFGVKREKKAVVYLICW